MIEPKTAFNWRQMTSSQTWQQWEGLGYPAERLTSVIYYFPGKANIENDEQRDRLAEEIKMDGIAPSKSTAHLILEDAIVFHGQVEYILGELWFYNGNSSGNLTQEIHEATWVELDAYED
jgi:hypothetical protein